MITMKINKYRVIVVLLSIFIITIMAPPYLIWFGYEGLASELYNFHSYDHQWIYRSECVFEDLSIQDCIIQGQEGNAYIETVYTKNGDPRYEGVIHEYNQNQIGWNKAEKVTRDGKVGYKFANDTRDYAIYLPWLLVMLVYPRLVKGRSKELPSPMWFVLALVPIGVDGTSQLLAGILNDPGVYWLSSFGLKESTNLIRWITGGIAGIAVGYFMIHFIWDSEERSRNESDKKETNKKVKKA